MKYYFYILAFSCLFSCKKQLYFQIEGHVYDKSLEKNMNGARLTLKQINPDGSEKNGFLADLIIDSDGKFNFSFKREKALKYILTIEKENYFSLVDEIGFDKLTAASSNMKIYDMYAKSWIKFHTINTNQANSSDVFTFLFFDFVYNCSECCQDKKILIPGAVENIFYCLYEAGKTYDFRYTVSSPFEQVDFSITPSAFDTVEFYKAY